jgi:predicted transcriptional regulator
MTTLKVGIATYDEMKQRTLAIARGDRKPGRDEPKVWFTSMQSAARILSAENRSLLGLIHAKRPSSIAELAALSGRSANNLSRTLKTMSRLGLVNMEKGEKGRKAPRFAFDEIRLEIPIPSAPSSLEIQAAE